jgi:hypothetical protein
VSGKGRQPHPNALPNYDNAIIPPEKLTKYALNPKHISKVWGKSSGQDKARVFSSALGFDLSNWELLRDRILEEVPFYEALAGHGDEYGKRYSVTMAIRGANGNTANVLTGWIIMSGSDYPILTTLYCV